MRPPADEAVTPVIGTVLMLGISALAITLILVGGAPILDRLQGAGALQTMTDEFQQIRTTALDLNGPDAQRSVPIQLPAGSIDFVSGGRYMVTVDAAAGCDFHVAGWALQPPALINPTSVVITAPNACGLPPVADFSTPILTIPGCGTSMGRWCIGGVYEVNGPTLTALDYSYTFASQTIALTTGSFDPAKDYEFRFYDDPATLNVVADSWLLHTDDLRWARAGSSSHAIEFAGGALMATDGNAVSVAAAPAFEERTGPAALYLRLVTLRGDGTGLNALGAHRVLLRSDPTALRDAMTANQVRFDMDGPLEQEWCRMLDLRDGTRTTGNYQPATAFSPIRATIPGSTDPTSDCDALPDPAGIANPVRSVLYAPNASFPLTFLHANLQASIQV